jgi:hypothetical protein
MPAPLAVDWQEIRRASEGGVDDAVLSERFQVNRNSLRARKMRENWTTPAKVQAEAEVVKLKAMQRGRNNSSLVAATGATEPTGMAVLGENLATYGKTGNFAAVKLLHSLLTNAKVEDLEPLSDAAGIVTTLKGLRLGTGLDKEGAVQVNLAMFSQAAPQATTGEWLDA